MAVDLITDALGPGWVTDLERLAELEPYAEDEDFRRDFREVKAARTRRGSTRCCARATASTCPTATCST